VTLRRPWTVFLFGLAPVVFVWMILVGWLAWLISDRAGRSEGNDQAAIREWLDETRNFRKTLPELIRDYRQLKSDRTPDDSAIRFKWEEIEEHLRALNEPLRTYTNQLPLFPEVYRLEIHCDGEPGPVYESGLPRPQLQTKTLIRELSYSPKNDPGVSIVCQYRLHAANKLLIQENERRQQAILAVCLLVAATILAGLFVYRFLRTERQREMQRLTTLAEVEHRERELAEASSRQKELERDLLQRKLDAQELETRAATAEAAAAEMRTQLFANIGIMAGSYAHNIKNLLVRPNDLLARCLETDGLSATQSTMLSEVKSTLGTVSDRLQQILSTIRRDPAESSIQKLNLNTLIGQTIQTWSALADSKWKVKLSSQLASGDLWIEGDESNVQQLIENLIFNARDATFEMRNHQRESVRNDPALDATTRRNRLIDAAAWEGHIILRTIDQGPQIDLCVQDNGIGMTEAIREQCLTTHFSTKRDNALYEGHAAGMGLGLSFVATIAASHHATIDIESQRLAGASFCIRFPKVTA
jgi:signal transduction histidine kinase